MTDAIRGDDGVDGIAAWLLRQGLKEATPEEIVRGFGERLVEAGAAVCRVSLGGVVLHPNFGALDVEWNAADDALRSQIIPREFLSATTVTTVPFARSRIENLPLARYRLDRGGGAWFPLFDRLKAQGVTEYVVFNTACGVDAEHESRATGASQEAIMLALATRREGGFDDDWIKRLEALRLPFALAAKAAIFKNLIQTLLRTYLGRMTGPNVLDGQVERGDGREIDCVLFYCDLRDSTRLAEQMPLDDYLALINDYFDCTAGSVIAHGGEVLKFIGDAVMAIFPVGGDERALPAMRRAAIDAAREALARRDRLRAGGRSQLDFGIALHVGKVKYGNVGTAQRLDFTVIGAPVNAVTRMEGLSKTLGRPLIASAEFSRGAEAMAPLGAHRLAGIAGEVEVFTIA